MTRDAGINFEFQALIYPATRLYFCTTSHQKYCSGYLLTEDAQVWFHDQYPRSDADRDDWRASPAFADGLVGVAPAYVQTCGYDPLLDEGKEYANKLEQAGVNMTYRCYEGQVYGFITMDNAIDEANDAVF